MHLVRANITRSPCPPQLYSAPSVFVVDEDSAARQSFEKLIRHAGWQPVAFASAQDFLAHAPEYGPCCLILDVSFSRDLLDLQQRIAAAQRGMPIIAVADNGDIPMAVQAMKAGATEFLTKPVSGEALLAVIRDAIEQSHAAVAQEERQRLIRERHETLSCRERQVMGLVVSGLLNKQVGGKLGISEITVKAHRGKVMRKMNAKSLADLVRMGSMLGAAVAGNC